MNKDDFCLEDFRLHESRVFRDPIHGYIRVFYAPIWKLINTKEMQRLRRIHQLGGTHQVYQTAEHSRFTHSLGVYEVVLQMLELESFQGILNDYERLVSLCAALLHDLGHGPFSHSFEHVFKKSHEDFTQMIILSKDTEVHQVLESVYPTLSEDVASVINKTYPNKIVVGLVSSQLDGDRMDYLLRDSYFTGTAYGQFDKERILRTLRVYQNQIVFKESGVQAIEDYILARYHMYWQVYYHPVTRSYERVLINIFKRLKTLYQMGYHFNDSMPYLMPFISGQEVTLKQYLLLDEPTLLYYFSLFQNELDPILSDLCHRFLERKLFKYRPLKDQQQLNKVKQVCLENNFDPDYYVAMDDPKQTPYKHYGASSEVEEIKILKNDGTICTLPEASEIVYAILNSNISKQDKKVYFPKEIKEKLD